MPVLRALGSFSFSVNDRQDSLRCTIKTPNSSFLIIHLSKHKFMMNKLSSITVISSTIGIFFFPLSISAQTQISIDPYNDSGSASSNIPFEPKRQAVTPNQPLPTNQNNAMGQVIINGNPTPSRPNVVQGNLIRSNQTLPQIPPLSEPYSRPSDANNINPNSPDNEFIESKNNSVSVSPFDITPTDNQSSTPERKPVNNNSNVVRSINLSPNSSPSSTVNTTDNNPTPPTPLGRRRTLQDILVFSNTPTQRVNPQISTSSTQSGEVYKVLVSVNNSTHESQLRSLYPEAFRTTFNGQSMLQVGVFSSPNKADDVSRSLENMGFRSTIVN